jgi:hypothetical protein
MLRKIEDVGVYQMAKDFHNSLKLSQLKAAAE